MCTHVHPQGWIVLRWADLQRPTPNWQTDTLSLSQVEMCFTTFGWSLHLSGGIPPLNWQVPPLPIRDTFMSAEMFVTLSSGAPFKGWCEDPKYRSLSCSVGGMVNKHRLCFLTSKKRPVFWVGKLTFIRIVIYVYCLSKRTLWKCILLIEEQIIITKMWALKWFSVITESMLEYSKTSIRHNHAILQVYRYSAPSRAYAVLQYVPLTSFGCSIGAAQQPESPP